MMNAFQKWLTYINERSPLPALLFLSAGIATSSLAFTAKFDWLIFLVGITINTVIFIQMRLGDELKDYENDKIINPTRPLPRGLLTTQEVFRVLIAVAIFLVISGAALIFFSWPAGLAVIISALFAWLMFKEFYIGQSLARSPMIYALTHQIIVFPIFGWVGVLIEPGLITHPPFLGWLLANFGASFTFEICRKLDPNAHELARTYAHHYGRAQTLFYCAIFIAYSAVGAWIGQFFWYALPVLFALFISLIIWSRKPSTYKMPAAFSALSSAIILWAPALIWLFSRWSSQ